MGIEEHRYLVDGNCFRFTKRNAGFCSRSEPRQYPALDILKGCLSFAALMFYGVGCGKPPTSVWLGAKLTRIQFTPLPGSRTTGITRNG